MSYQKLLETYPDEIKILINQSFNLVAKTRKTGILTSTAKQNILVGLKIYSVNVIKSGLKDFLTNYQYITDAGDRLLLNRVKAAYVRQQVKKNEEENRREVINLDRQRIEDFDRKIIEIIQSRYGHKDVLRVPLGILKQIQEEVKGQ